MIHKMSFRVGSASNRNNYLSLKSPMHNGLARKSKAQDVQMLLWVLVLMIPDFGVFRKD